MVSKVSPKTPARKRPHYMEGVLKGTAKANWWQKFGRGIHLDKAAKMIIITLSNLRNFNHKNNYKRSKHL